MGFKGYRLWVMGQLDSNVQRPTVVGRTHAVRAPELRGDRELVLGRGSSSTTANTDWTKTK
jgi:hypothetical protein